MIGHSPTLFPYVFRALAGLIYLSVLFPLHAEAQGRFVVIGYEVEGTPADGQLERIAEAGGGEYLRAAGEEEIARQLTTAMGGGGTGGVAISRRSGGVPAAIPAGTGALILILIFGLTLIRRRGRTVSRAGSEPRSAPPGTPIPPLSVSLSVGERPEQRLSIRSSPSVIGRGRGAELSVPDDGVSRRHLSLEVEGGRWFARDLRSRNGTWMGDRRIDRIEVRDGLDLRLGRQTRVEFQLVAEDTALPRPR